MNLFVPKNASVCQSILRIPCTFLYDNFSFSIFKQLRSSLLSFFSFNMNRQVHTAKDLSIRTTTSRWEQPTFSPPAASGDGFTVEGKLVEMRNHHLADRSGKHHRFLALTVDVTCCVVRVFTAQGEERNPKFNPEDNVARKGYLNSYQKVDTKNPYAVDIESLWKAVGSASSCLPDNYFDLHQSKLHPKVSGRFEFWGDGATLKYHDLNIKPGAGCVIRTKGNSIFIDEVTAKNEEGTSFSAGTSSGENWTNKVFAHKDATPVEDKREAGDACDEDEWD